MFNDNRCINTTLYYMNKFYSFLYLCFGLLLIPVGASADTDPSQQAEQDLTRSMSIVDKVIDRCFTGDVMKMCDLYYISSGLKTGTADVWPYTAAIEAVNSIIEAMDATYSFAPQLSERRSEYVDLLNNLITNIEYYSGQFYYTSYTLNNHYWQVFGVHRSNVIGGATVSGIENVYDDQEWILREMIRAYYNTGNTECLNTAEYLANYVIDGWDCTLDENGNEYGGISWGPGYNSKHSCSNGPCVQPFVWLSNIYKDNSTKVTYRYIDADGNRIAVRNAMTKHDYYLMYAKKIYQWQRENLLAPSGCFYDMLGADNTRKEEVINGVTYRAHVATGSAGGTQYTYNTGTMIAGAQELYAATDSTPYRRELRSMANSAFNYFKGAKQTIDGEDYYPFPFDSDPTSGFTEWFNDVLMRAYVDAADNTSASALAIDAYQRTLDYAYDNYLQEGFLPNDLLGGWHDGTVTKPFHQLAFASVFAEFAKYYGKQAVTGIKTIQNESNEDNKKVNVYSVAGQMIRKGVTRANALSQLPQGIYIVDGTKVMVK